jgi:hypothetical protein
MLVTFSCPAYADITMFGDVAIQLLKMMGHSGSVPSALLAEDVPAALQRLQAALKTDIQENFSPASSANEDEDQKVPLSHRALPLIELLKASAKEECNVMWSGNQ